MPAALECDFHTIMLRDDIAMAGTMLLRNGEPAALAEEEVRELPERALKHIAADLECRACIGAEADPVASFL